MPLDTAVSTIAAVQSEPPGTAGLSPSYLGNTDFTGRVSSDSAFLISSVIGIVQNKKCFLGLKAYPKARDFYTVTEPPFTRQKVKNSAPLLALPTDISQVFTGYSRET